MANVLLIRQTWRADRTAAVLLVPYAGWTVFATALNAEIVRLNPSA
ncbi:MAG TPA: tryptophan-rich sensory protein [Streptosporangiaceae bacterium]|nr:tryptophan-rich sensory protein [Streptosporangiaceae bacterium]